MSDDSNDFDDSIIPSVETLDFEEVKQSKKPHRITIQYNTTGIFYEDNSKKNEE